MLGILGVQLVLVSANFIPPYEHHIGIYIRADGSIEPATAPIQRNGELFKLTDNASIGIAIERSYITFDGNGFTLKGSGGTGCLLKADGIVAQHLTLIGFEYGIYVSSSYCKVEENILTGCSLRAGYSSNIIGNNIGGIIEIYSNDTSVSNNKANQITLQGSNITVSNNQIIKNERIDIRLLSQWDDRSGGAINIVQGDSCNIINNTITNQSVAINVWYSTNIVFSANTLINNQIGIAVSSTSLKQYLHRFDLSNTVNGKQVYYLVNKSDIKVPNNAGWVAAINCKNISVQDWVSTPNWDGVLFAFTTDSKISNCTLNQNFNGIRLHNASNIRIIGNSIKDNGYAAFYLKSPYTSLISYNDVSNNYCFFNIWEGTEGNIVYYNNFVGTIVGGSSAPVQNMWDNGSKGNYWSTFGNTLDQNNDSIVDQPYVINDYSRSVDYYPLVKPIDFSQTLIDFNQIAPSFSPNPYTSPTPTTPSPIPTPTPVLSTSSPSDAQAPSPSAVQPTPLPELSLITILPISITTVILALFFAKHTRRHQKSR
jgi:parallel beta-helix repeat protein